MPCGTQSGPTGVHLEARWLCKHGGGASWQSPALREHKLRTGAFRSPASCQGGRGPRSPVSPAGCPAAGCSWLPRSLSRPPAHPLTPLPHPHTQPRLSRLHPGLPGNPVLNTREHGHTHTAHTRASRPVPTPRSTSQPSLKCKQPLNFIINRLRAPQRRHMTDSEAAGERLLGPQGPGAAGHRARLRQAWQRGWTGRQVCWPKPTNSPLISLHSSLWGWQPVSAQGEREGGRWGSPAPTHLLAPGQPLLQGSSGLLRGLGLLPGPSESVGNSVHMRVHCCRGQGGAGVGHACRPNAPVSAHGPEPRSGGHAWRLSPPPTPGLSQRTQNCTSWPRGPESRSGLGQDQEGLGSVLGCRQQSSALAVGTKLVWQQLSPVSWRDVMVRDGGSVARSAAAAGHLGPSPCPPRPATQGPACHSLGTPRPSHGHPLGAWPREASPCTAALPCCWLPRKRLRLCPDANGESAGVT